MTPEATMKLEAYLATHTLCEGLGTEESACSIAAINLAISGQLTDDIPDCMSVAIGKWIIVIQDAMPDDMRNSDRWKSLLPLAAGTGQDHEKERLEIILDWMWGVLARLQPLADAKGFGDAWRTMLTERTSAAANAAADAAREAACAAEWAADATAYAAACDTACAAADAEAIGHAEFWDAIDPGGLLERLINVSK